LIIADTVRSCHAGGKLDGTGYTAGDDQLRTDSSSGKSDLMCNISESVFYHRTGEGKLSAKGICQFPEGRKSKKSAWSGGCMSGK